MPEGKTNKSLGLLAMAGVEPYQAAPGEEYMNPKQLEHFRKILDAWRQQLREEVDRTKNHMADEAANFPDPVDRAAQEEEFSLELRAPDRERKLLKKIASGKVGNKDAIKVAPKVPSTIPVLISLTTSHNTA